jgi:hypothetical protein
MIGGISSFLISDAPKMPLTAIAVQRAKPAAKPQRLFDGGGL